MYRETLARVVNDSIGLLCPKKKGKEKMTKRRRNSVPLNNTIGKLIRHYRLSKGLTQTELGDECLVTFQQIQKYENGTNGCNAEMLLVIWKVLNIPIRILITLIARLDVQTLPNKNKANKIDHSFVNELLGQSISPNNALIPIITDTGKTISVDYERVLTSGLKNDVDAQS